MRREAGRVVEYVSNLIEHSIGIERRQVLLQGQMHTRTHAHTHIAQYTEFDVHECPA